MELLFVTIVYWDYLFYTFYSSVIVSPSSNGFIFFWSAGTNVSFIKYIGQMAKHKNIDMNAMGSIPILSAKSTAKGAISKPHKLNP